MRTVVDSRSTYIQSIALLCVRAGCNKRRTVVDGRSTYIQSLALLCVRAGCDKRREVHAHSGGSPVGCKKKQKPFISRFSELDALEPAMKDVTDVTPKSTIDFGRILVLVINLNKKSQRQEFRVAN